MYRLREADFSLIDFDDAFQWFAIRLDHRAPELLRQQPSGFVGHAEFVLQLQRRHAVGMRRHHMRRPEPCRQRQFGAMYHGAGGDRGLPPAIKTFVQTRATFQHGRAALAAGGADKTFRLATLEQKGGATGFVGKRFLKLRKRTRASR